MPSKEASDVFRRELEIHPKNSEAIKQLARCLEKDIPILESDLLGTKWMGSIIDTLNRKQVVGALLRKAITINPEDRQAIFRLATLIREGIPVEQADLLDTRVEGEDLTRFDSVTLAALLYKKVMIIYPDTCDSIYQIATHRLAICFLQRACLVPQDLQGIRGHLLVRIRQVLGVAHTGLNWDDLNHTECGYLERQRVVESQCLVFLAKKFFYNGEIIAYDLCGTKFEGKNFSLVNPKELAASFFREAISNYSKNAEAFEGLARCIFERVPLERIDVLRTSFEKEDLTKVDYYELMLELHQKAESMAMERLRPRRRYCPRYHSFSTFEGLPLSEPSAFHSKSAAHCRRVSV